MKAAANELFSLGGKTILVTGGTRGIGRAISLRFARSGANVIAIYIRNANAAQEMSALAAAEGLTITLCRADLTQPNGLSAVGRAVQDANARLAGFVHCAATGVHRPIEELTGRHLDWTFALNFRVFFELIKILLVSFADRASVIAVSSAGATRASPTYSLIGASKGALESLSRHMAVELAPKGIRVNIIAPGAVLTDAWAAIPNSEARLATAIQRTPTGRLVTVDEVACAAQFLCSEAAAGIVGQTLVIDGGASILV